MKANTQGVIETSEMRDCLFSHLSPNPNPLPASPSFMKLPSTVRYFLALGLSLGFLSTSTAMAGINPEGKAKEPPITYVQGMIWKRLNLSDFTLNGEVRNDKTKKSYPLMLLTKGHTLVYKFTNQPLQIRVLLAPDKFTVEKRSGEKDKWTAVSGAEMNKSILDTDISYEDLGIDFMNWDKVTPLGTDAIKTLDAYVFEAQPGPNDHSRFAKVRYWVSSQYWAFLRVDGLNAKDQTVKRVEVQDVMQIGKFSVFKQMKVATMMPDRNDIASSTTFVDIKDGHEGSGLQGDAVSETPADAPSTLPPIPTDTIPVAPVASGADAAPAPAAQ